MDPNQIPYLNQEVSDINPSAVIEEQQDHVRPASQNADFYHPVNNEILSLQNHHHVQEFRKGSSPRQSQNDFGIPIATGEEMKGPGSQKSSHFSSSAIFKNQEPHQNIENHQHERKYSHSFKSPGLMNVQLPRSGTKRLQNSSRFLSRSATRRQTQIKLVHISNPLEQDALDQQPQIEMSAVKKSAISNSFSNRSQGSHPSNRSNKSNQSSSSYRYNRFVDTMQVPQIVSLQVVKDGRSSRVQRRSSLSSHHSRSASTCKKSYDDYSQLQMQKIDESVCQQLDEKSVKRSAINPTRSRAFQINQDFQFQANLEQLKNSISSKVIENQPVQEFIYSKYIQSQQGKQQPQQIVNNQTQDIFNYQAQNRFNYVKQKSYDQFSSFNEQSIKEENELSHLIERQKICRQVSIQCGNQKGPIEFQFDNKSIQVDSVSEISIKTTPSQKLIKQNQRKIQQRQLKIQRLSMNRIQYLFIENALQKDERFNNFLQICQQFISNAHNSSNFGRSQFKQMLVKHFQVFGTEINPIDEVGQRLYHDGLFANSYITFVKGSRNNSGMIQSMLYTQFEEQALIVTNKEVFYREFKRVKQEREMHYQNEFQKRIKEYEQKKHKQQALRLTDLQAKMAQMERKMQQPVKKITLQDMQVDTKDIEKYQPKRDLNRTPRASNFNYYEPNSQSNISVFGSNDTVTVSDVDDVIQNSIRRSPIVQATKSNHQISRNSQDLRINFQQFQDQNYKLKQKQPTKKVQKSKKRYTKGKENKKSQKKIIEKEQENSQDAQQTISQIHPISRLQYSKGKQQNQSGNQEIQIETENNKVTKGILRYSRQHKEDQRNKKKDKKQQTILSAQKNQNQKNSKDSYKSKKKEERVSRKKKNKNSTDAEADDQTDFSEPYSLKKVSLEKKKNAGKVVKFTNSTKGGESPYIGRENDDFLTKQKQEKGKNQTQGQKRKTRSRSKK